jgi:hypothetical protein
MSTQSINHEGVNDAAQMVGGKCEQHLIAYNRPSPSCYRMAMGSSVFIAGGGSVFSTMYSLVVL